MWTLVFVIATVGTACVAGVLFAFSSFVMPALGQVPAAEAIRAMQSINVFAQRAPFGLVILAAALAAIALSIRHLSAWQGTASVLVLVGTALYLVIGFGVSGAINIPLNNSLALATPSAADAAAVWRAYTQPWELANHVRTAAGLLASAAFALSALVKSA